MAKKAAKKKSDMHLHILQKKREAKEGFKLRKLVSKVSKPAENELTLRREIVALWKSNEENDHKYLDRIMLAMHRYQTDGQLEYRRMCGMHGGGGGNKSKEFEKILAAKAKKDIEPHYDETEGKVEWPDEMPNVVPEPYNLKDTPFVYKFCWHGQVPFIIWHRPLMREFERGLQMHDPDFNDKDESATERFFGKDALGAPYWAWEEWAGHFFPKVIGNKEYEFRTSKYEEKFGIKKGDKIPNPYYRWLAPVSVKDQLEEEFPKEITDENCSTRDPAYEDPTKEPIAAWIQTRDHPEMSPAMSDVCKGAMAENDFEKFASTKCDPLWSIEHPHNWFHNRVGNTMPTLQSIYDPIFWLHHSNVERQLCSWQGYHFNHLSSKEEIKKNGGFNLKPRTPKSVPTEKLLDTVLYPWTKPEKLEEEKCYSWNTPSDVANDGTLRDWFYAELTYNYETYLEAVKVDHHDDIKMQLAVTVKEKYLTGNFGLIFDGQEIAVISRLNGYGKGCGRCEGKEPILVFDVSWLFWNLDSKGAKKKQKKLEDQIKDDLQDNLVVKRNGLALEVVKFEFHKV